MSEQIGRIFTKPAREQYVYTLAIASTLGVLGVVLLFIGSGWLSFAGSLLCAGPGGTSLGGWWGRRRDRRDAERRN
jgi:hypothetical protein